MYDVLWTKKSRPGPAPGLGPAVRQCVGKTRKAAGRSVEETAHLAGMETSQWAAIEAGYVPDPAKLRPMADALEIGYGKIASAAVLCREGWEQ